LSGERIRGSRRTPGAGEAHHRWVSERRAGQALVRLGRVSAAEGDANERRRRRGRRSAGTRHL